MKKKVLLAEDDTMSRDIIRIRLERNGLNVFAAKNGAEAIEAANSENFDIIILDLSMPRRDGFETVKRLKSSPKTSETPVLALTAHSMDRDRQRALLAGFDDFDSKPVDIKRLMRKITYLIEQEK